MPGVCWGRADTLFTPAYWSAQAWFVHLDGSEPDTYAIGATLSEEIAACLLGGYGIPAEVGLAAFHQVRSHGLLEGKPPSPEECFAVLKEPLHVSERLVRYRFARQKSRYLSAALHVVSNEAAPAGTATTFRDWLTGIPGIGLKTASWITRNWLQSDAVAILDVHIMRAGVLSGLFSPHDSLPGNYRKMEDRFLQFAHQLKLRPRFLDALIWATMRRAGPVARDLLLHFHGSWADS